MTNVNVHHGEEKLVLLNANFVLCHPVQYTSVQVASIQWIKLQHCKLTQKKNLTLITINLRHFNLKCKIWQWSTDNPNSLNFIVRRLNIIHSNYNYNYNYIRSAEEWNWQGMWHIWWTGQVQTGIWWADLREWDHLQDLDTNRMIILKWICKRYDGEAWTGLLWLRIGTDGGHLQMW